jgi:hypothetical protein
MPFTVFFSWQADRPNPGGQTLIERAINEAIKNIRGDLRVERAIRDLEIDRDTQGVSGSPPIVETIFQKIDKAAIFVPDLTFVGTRHDGRPTPNPNVLIEYGWALRALGYRRIVPVMNIAFGQPTAEAMPFNMRHLRNPITYESPDGLDENAQQQVKEHLTAELERELRAVFQSQEFLSTLPKPPEPKMFVARASMDGLGRFKPRQEAVGIASRGFEGVREIRLSEHPAIWFRMMPVRDPERTWSIEDLDRTIKANILHPLTRSWSSYGFMRGPDGAGLYAALDQNREIAGAIVYAFTTGELWSIDTYWLHLLGSDKRNEVPQLDNELRQTLLEYGEFLKKLSVTPPYRWVTGMESLKGRNLFVPSRSGYGPVGQGPQGRALKDIVEASGTYSPGEPTAKVLRSFFTQLYASCGVVRQEWQD